MTPQIESKFIGRFIGDRERKEFVANGFEWPRLHNLKAFFNLSSGIDTFNHDPTYRDNIKMIQQYILDTATEYASLKDAIHGCDLVTNCNTLTKIAAYRNLEFEWQESPALYGQFVFCKFKNVIFGVERRLDEPEETSNQRRDTYQKYKFKQHMTTESANVRIFAEYFKF